MALPIGCRLLVGSPVGLHVLQYSTIGWKFRRCLFLCRAKTFVFIVHTLFVRAPFRSPCGIRLNIRDSASRVTDDALRLLENLALAFIATAPPPDRSRVYIDVSEMESGDAGGVSREGEGERHLEGAQQQAVGAGGADSDWEAVSKEEIGDQVEVSSSGDRLDEDAEIGKEGIGVGQGRTGEADVTHDAEGGGEHSAVGNGRKGDDGVGDGVGQAEPKEEEEEEPQGWCAQVQCCRAIRALVWVLVSFLPPRLCFVLLVKSKSKSKSHVLGWLLCTLVVT